MTRFIKNILKKARENPKRIGFCDYTDNRLYEAVKRILRLRIAKPYIFGEEELIKEKLKKFRIRETYVNIIDPLKSPEFNRFREQYYSMRKEKGVTLEQAENYVKKPHYFAVMMLYNDLIDGVVTGLSSETKPFLPAFKIIKTRPGITKVSSVFIMDFKDKTLFFADCAVNINPTKEELAEIAVLTNETVSHLGFKPKVAMLSFSTHGSAKHELVDKVREATLIAGQKNPKMILDGEIQFDAAFVPSVFKKKCPTSSLKGEANTFIFPDLDSGNIAYKLVERLAHAKAIGPILQGLKKPINDISRGASYEDLVNITALTVVQAQKED